MPAANPKHPNANRETVLAWMRTTRRGQKAASVQFGVPLSTVRKWERDAKKAAGPDVRPLDVPDDPQPLGGSVTYDPTAGTHSDYLRRLLVDLHTQLAEASPRDAAALAKQAMATRQKLEELQAAEKPPTTDAEDFEMLVDGIAGWPPAERERFWAAVQTRAAGEGA